MTAIDELRQRVAVEDAQRCERLEKLLAGSARPSLPPTNLEIGIVQTRPQRAERRSLMRGPVELAAHSYRLPAPRPHVPVDPRVQAALERQCRNRLIAELRAGGMSQEKIAFCARVSRTTVRRVLQAAGVTLR